MLGSPTVRGMGLILERVECMTQPYERAKRRMKTVAREREEVCGALLRRKRLADGTFDSTSPRRYCQKRRVQGRSRCELHGGTTPVGVASPHYKDGHRSRYATLPPGILERFRELDDNQAWLSMHAEIKLLVARMERAAAHGKWPKWDQLSERLRLLMDSEMKRREQAQTMLSLERAMTIVDKLVEAVRKHVPDRAQFGAIYQEIQQSLAGRTASPLPLLAPPPQKGTLRHSVVEEACTRQ